MAKFDKVCRGDMLYHSNLKGVKLKLDTMKYHHEENSIIIETTMPQIPPVPLISTFKPISQLHNADGKWKQVKLFDHYVQFSVPVTCFV